MPGMALLAILSAKLALEAETPRWVKKWKTGCVLFFSLVNAGWWWVIYYSHNTHKVTEGHLTREEFLSFSRPAYPIPSYAAIRFINENTPPESRILVIGDSKAFHLQRPYVASTVMNLSPLAVWAEETSSPEELQRKLLEEGISHILVNALESYRTRGYIPFTLSPGAAERLSVFWGSYLDEIFYFVEEGVNLRVYSISGDTDKTASPAAQLPFYYRIRGVEDSD